MTTTLQSDVSRQKVLEDCSERRSFSMFPFNVKQLVEAFKVAEERSADLLIISENNLNWFSYFMKEDYNGKFILDAPCPVAVISDRQTTAP
jgi:hypothetical protein